MDDNLRAKNLGITKNQLRTKIDESEIYACQKMSPSFFRSKTVDGLADKVWKRYKLQDLTQIKT